MVRLIGYLLIALLSPLEIMVAIDPLAARERGTTEIEDVSTAEKIQWARATTVLITDAIKTVTTHMPGKVIEAALHAVGGRLLYEIEVVTADGKVVEVFVDPQTGKLIHPGE